MPRLASGLSLAALQSALLLLLLGGHLSSHTAIAVDGAGPGSPTAVSLRQTDGRTDRQTNTQTPSSTLAKMQASPRGSSPLPPQASAECKGIF